MDLSTTVEGAVLLVSPCTDPVWPAICADGGVLLLAGEDETAWPAKLEAAAGTVNG